MRMRYYVVGLLCVVAPALLASLSGCAAKSGASDQAKSEGGKPTAADQARMDSGSPPGGPSEKGAR